MVYLNRITTKAGDDGSTGLGDGSRVSKTHRRIAAMGTVDELNASLGVALSISEALEPIATSLRSVQNELFDLGAELCFPPTNADDVNALPTGITMAAVERLEQLTDETVGRLQPLQSFILPGGTPFAAALHLARTVCRRAERDVLALAEMETVSPSVRVYLNRLSDLLFVWARMANDDGRQDVLWKPGDGELPHVD